MLDDLEMLVKSKVMYLNVLRNAMCIQKFPKYEYHEIFPKYLVHDSLMILEMLIKH